ncbi:MAG TPA: homoserine dehydrogenase [Terriglobia bacterium]|nr:homoserine dehydrogenase [Terriglobia bacterium]
MKQRINIGLIGLGTVGTGVVNILQKNAELIRRRLGVPVEVVSAAVRDLKRDRGLSLKPGVLTTNPKDVIDNPDVDIVVELIGGIEPARSLILDAISRGKQVVTANKALLAEHGDEIFTKARAASVQVGFEASVGGGIPVIKTLKESLAANRILSIYGIINGTSNYILTKMTDEDRQFPDVLAEAQKAGYAEADPTFDIEGIDTAHKLAILVNLAFGTHVKPSDIYTEGISSIRPIDIDFGKEFGYKLKLLAIAKYRDHKVEVRVHPTMVPDEYPIAKIQGVYNAIQIVGDACEDIMLSGRGAGSLPTGSAVVADIMDIGRSLLTGSSRALPTPPDGAEPVQVQPMSNVESLYYLRFMVIDRPGVLSQISGILGRYNISIASVIQRVRKQDSAVPLVIMTHTAREQDMGKALGEIKQLACISEDPVLIRVEGEER